MVNISDYLNWRGDVPFSVDPFNEVDNLILALLAYADFRGIVPPDGQEVSLQAVRQAYFERYPREELQEDASFAGRAALLMDEMVTGGRFRDMALCFSLDELDTQKEVQLAAMTFRLGDGSAYIAFRGTDGTIVGWKEDFHFSYQDATEGQNRAVEYLQRVASAVDAPLRVGGHSKGGNLAVYAAAFCGPQLQERLLSVYSNDGPGFRQDITEREGYDRILPKVVSIIPDTVIGLLLTSRYRHLVVKSDAAGILQHDGFTWQVLRNRFVTSQLTPTGEFIEQTLSLWLEQMDNSERETFTNTVFFPFEATGAETLAELGEQKWKTAEAFLTSLRDIPRENQKDTLRILGQLAQSGGKTAATYLRGLTERE